MKQLSVAQIKGNYPIRGGEKPADGTKMRDAYDRLFAGEVIRSSTLNVGCIDQLEIRYGLDIARVMLPSPEGKYRQHIYLRGEYAHTAYIPFTKQVDLPELENF